MRPKGTRWWRLQATAHAPKAKAVFDVDSDGTDDPSAIPTLSLDSRGLAYGDGFFTTMAVRDGHILWSAYHQNRLRSHAHALQLMIDAPTVIVQAQSCAEQMQQGVLKLIVTRAPQDMRGYGFAASELGSACEVWLKSMPSALDASTVIQSIALANGCFISQQPPIRAVCLSAQLACLPPPLAGLKTLNRLDNVMASAELQSRQAEQLSAHQPELTEGLVRDMTGAWVEGTMSNVFYQLSSSPADADRLTSKDGEHNYLTSGQWFTPSLATSGVDGVMRQVIIDSFKTTTNPVIIRTLTDEDLPTLSQLFFCNAVRGILPVSELTLSNGDVVGLSL